MDLDPQQPSVGDSAAPPLPQREQEAVLGEHRTSNPPPPALQSEPLESNDTLGPSQTAPPPHPQKPRSSSRGAALERDSDDLAAPMIHPEQTVVIDYSDASTSGYVDPKEHAVDKTHTVFLYVSVPMTGIACILALVLYLTDSVAAVEASHSVAGFCAVCATVLTIFLIYCHLSSYTNPVQQRYICRILVMVPIYAIDSFAALTAYRYGNVVALVRDTYEAYVIYQFYMLLMDYVGGPEQLVRMWQRQHNSAEPTMDHLFPLSLCCKPLRLDSRTLEIWKVCLVQYMILNPLLTMITLPLYFTGKYHDGAFTPTDAYGYLAGIRFWSVTFAFTSLVYFFFASKDLIASHKPLPKFAAIKVVVFLSFWQSVLLAGLNHFDVIPRSQLWTTEEVTVGLNNFVTCIEMYLVSLAHRWVFSDEPYVPLSGRVGLTKWACMHVLSISDIVEETADAWRVVSPKGDSVLRASPAA